jgi:hypothetical protein
MKAEETTASTSLLKDCFPGSSIEEVHGIGEEIHGGRANKASDKDIGGEVDFHAWNPRNASSK